MPGWSEIAPFALLGLAGAAHCAGMCGGFAIAVTLSAGPARRAALGRALAYVLGKALTYSLLGLAAARAAELLVGPDAALGFELGEDELARLRGALALAVGAGLVVAGIAACRSGRRSSASAALGSRLGTWLRPLFQAVRGLPGCAGALGTGVVTGLLPCGLSWSAIALALLATPAAGALGLFVFGCATAPALLAVGFGARALPERWRAWAPRLAGPLLVALGLFTAVRGGLPGPLGGARAVLPDCCAAPAPAE